MRSSLSSLSSSRRKKMEVKPAKIVLSGQAFNTNAVANFIENLDLVAVFKEPVLKDTNKKGDIYNFVVEFNYAFVPPRRADGEDPLVDSALNS